MLGILIVSKIVHVYKFLLYRDNVNNLNDLLQFKVLPLPTMLVIIIINWFCCFFVEQNNNMYVLKLLCSSF